jgi:hypothetical protein
LNWSESELPAGPSATTAAIQIASHTPSTTRLWRRAESVSAANGPLCESWESPAV